MQRRELTSVQIPRPAHINVMSDRLSSIHFFIYCSFILTLT